MSLDHHHTWVEKNRVTVPNEDGDYILPLWDAPNYVTRKVPSAYFECECGDGKISPIEREAQP